MKKTISRVALSIFSVALIASCNKYEDGPSVSLLTKKSRVANTWVIEKATDGDEDVTSSYEQYELYLTKDGNAKLTAKGSFAGVDFSTESTGSWDFQNSKEDIKLDFEDDDLDGTFRILRLKEDEFWYKNVQEDLEIQLKEK